MSDLKRDRKPWGKYEYDDLAIGRDLGPSAALVYFYLDLRSGQNDAAWPSQATIAEDLGFSRSTVQTAINTLLGNGLITVRQSSRHSGNEYVIHDAREGAWNRTAPAYDRKSVKVEQTTFDRIPVTPMTENQSNPRPKISHKVETPNTDSGKQGQSGREPATPDTAPPSDEIPTPQQARGTRDLIAAFAERRPNGMDPAIRAKQAGIAKRLITGTRRRPAYRFEDITGTMDFLAQQTWRNGWDMATVAGSIDAWIADGRPTEPTTTRKPSQYKTTEERTADGFAELYSRLGYANGTSGPDPDDDLEHDDAAVYVDVDYRTR
jgi:hypothetical protein